MKSVKIGLHKKTFTPYMHCKESLYKIPFVLVTIAPLVLLGIIPMIFSFIYFNNLLFAYSVIMTVSSVGDLIILYYVIPIPYNKKIKDHDSKIGFYIID